MLTEQIMANIFIVSWKSLLRTDFYFMGHLLKNEKCVVNIVTSKNTHNLAFSCEKCDDQQDNALQ